MNLEFSGEVWFWKGPSPFHFVTVCEADSLLIKEVAPSVTYGWGMIPCDAIIGKTQFTTSLWPKGDVYLLPIKAAVRKDENIEIGDTVDVMLTID